MNEKDTSIERKAFSQYADEESPWTKHASRAPIFQQTPPSPAPTQRKPSHLLTMPVELRQIILRNLLCKVYPISYTESLPGPEEEPEDSDDEEDIDPESNYAWIPLDLHPQILSVCKQLNAEGWHLLYKGNTWQLFVTAQNMRIIHPSVPYHGLGDGGGTLDVWKRTVIPASVLRHIESFSVRIRMDCLPGLSRSDYVRWWKYCPHPDRYLRDILSGKNVNVHIDKEHGWTDDVDADLRAIGRYMSPLQSIRCASVTMYVNNTVLSPQPQYVAIMQSNTTVANIPKMWRELRDYGPDSRYIRRFGDSSGAIEELEEQLRRAMEAWDEDEFRRVKEKYLEKAMALTGYSLEEPGFW